VSERVFFLSSSFLSFLNVRGVSVQCWRARWRYQMLESRILEFVLLICIKKSFFNS
jgi:hypothetical protein